MWKIITQNILYYKDVVLFLVPLGIVGAWRWSVWLIRKIVSFFYRRPTGNFRGTLSIITPVYNEEPDSFRLALHSWKDNDPDEIIAVIDYEDKRSIEVFEYFAKHFAGARLIVTKKPGKRAALVDGVRAARSEIVVLVDSDTIWSANIKNKMLAPFSDPRVGGVGPRQDIWQDNTLARKLFKFHLDNRFLNELLYLSVLGNALTCLSGRTAVYRRSAVLPLMYELEHEQFFGKAVISGDDKCLTRLVQRDGWWTKYLNDVVVYTPGFGDVRTFLKQLVRWNRNSWRSDLKTLGSGWVWKREMALALHMVDRFFPPFTLLLGPIYLITSLLLGYWHVAIVLPVWWMFSRGIKVLPHLRERPRDIFVLPTYIVFTYVVGVIKIYAFITMNRQGWITRWDAKRLASFGWFRRSFSYLVTLSVMLVMFFAVFNYRSEAIRVSNEERLARLELKKQSETERISFVNDVPRRDAAEIIQVKEQIAEANQNDPYGYYVTKRLDTLLRIKRRYNLDLKDKVWNAEKTAVITSNFLPAGQKISIPVADMQTPLNRETLRIQAPLRKFPRITYDAPANTIFIRQGDSIATIPQISRFLGPRYKNLLEQTGPNEWILRANLYVGKHVTLLIDGNQVSQLKLKSDDEKYIWIRSQEGNILISDTKVTSWNEKKNAPDENYADGRSFILAKNSGRMDVVRSEIAYLGYPGITKRGGEFGGSYGLSWKIKNGGFRDSLITGAVVDSSIHHNFFGIYTFGATGMVIRGNELYENAQYGIDPHDDSNNFIIENNRAFRNGRHGIIISRRCFNNIIRNNISYENKLHGIMIDRESDNNIVEGNLVYQNVDGIAIDGSHNNLILSNEIQNNFRGIRINRVSSYNYLEENIVMNNSRGFYLYDESKNNILVNNKIQKSDIGVTLIDASSNVLHDNFQSGENIKDGRIVGNSYGNDIK